MKRKCSKCKQVLDIGSFHKNQYYCKSCMYSYHRDKWDRVYGHKKKWSKENPEKHLERQRIGQRRYNGKYPEKIIAHRVANRHKEDLKKDCCEVCNGRDFLHMHHPRYENPLFILTLCKDCHYKTHYEER